MGQPRTRVRYKRLTAAGASCAITAVALLGGTGVIPSAGTTRPVAQASLSVATPRPVTAADTPASDSRASSTTPAERAARPVSPSSTADTQDVREAAAERGREERATAALAVPEASGDGKRVVFDQSAQRVWLVGAGGKVLRTYLVSGSVEDNLDPGTYEVYSRSVRAWGIDDGGTMKYMVRFAHGERAAIGFHDIPVKDGEKVQGRDELGTALSGGCIRQWRPDAKALWDFAPLGTTVVVVP